MKNSLLIPADPMLAALLKCNKNTPLTRARLEEIEQLDICPMHIASNYNQQRTAIMQLKDLRTVPDFAPLTGVKKLALRNLGPRSCNLPVWKTLLRGLDRLTALKELELWGSDTTDNPLELAHCPHMFARLEKMTLNDKVEPLLVQMPPQLDNLLTLRINGTVPLEHLLALQAPHLTHLRLKNVRGLRSISQLTDHFPALNELWVEGICAGHEPEAESRLDLGPVPQTLRRLVVNAPALGDWSDLPGSGICEMKLSGAEFDPSILPACTQMVALELSGCIFTREIPALAPMKNLNYLIINDCMLTDAGFARGLTELQIFNLDRNALDITDWKQDELPDELACLADMPNLLEFSIDTEIIQNLLMYCPTQFRRYSNELREDMLRLKS